MQPSRLAVSALSLCAVPAGAMAQTAAPTTTVDDAQIVVTATRQPMPIESVPMSVVVLDSDALERTRSYLGAEDLADLVPGVEAAVANGSQVAFQIRGIGAVDHQALTPTATAVYSDGVFLATNVQTGALLYDLARVEVLKGPQGTLYGRNASGGAINLISRRPDARDANYLRAGYGNFDRFDLDAAVGGAVREGVYARLAAKYLSRSPVLDNVGGPPEAGGERDEFGVRLSLLVDRGGPSLLLRGHYEGDTGINTTPLNDRIDLAKHEIESEGEGIQDSDNAFYGFSAEYGMELGSWDLFSLTAFEGYRQDYGFDFDGTAAPPSANLAYDRDFSQFSQELRLLRRFSWGSSLLGATAAVEDFTQRYTIWCGELDRQTLVGSCNYVGAAGRVGPQPASAAPASTLVTDIAQDRTALAAFSYNEVNLFDRLTLGLGMRLTREAIEGDGQGVHVFTDGTIGLNNRGGLGPAIGSNRIETTRLTGNASLGYALSNATAYASVSNGYKSGGFNGEVANNALHYSDDGLFAAEKVTALEVGLKSSGLQDVTYAIAAFHHDYQDPQARIFVQFPLPDGSSIVSNSLSNLDDARSYGIEGELQWRPAKGLDLDFAAVWNRTRIRQDSPIGGNSDLFDGNPLPFAPEFSASAGVRYAARLDGRTRLELGTHGRFRSRYYLDAEGLTERSQGAVFTLQAQANLVFEATGIELGVWGRNLTNRDYALSGYGFIGYNTFRSDPRTYGVSLSAQF